MKLKIMYLNILGFLLATGGAQGLPTEKLESPVQLITVVNNLGTDLTIKPFVGGKKTLCSPGTCDVSSSEFVFNDGGDQVIIESAIFPYHGKSIVVNYADDIPGGPSLKIVTGEIPYESIPWQKVPRKNFGLKVSQGSYIGGKMAGRDKVAQMVHRAQIDIDANNYGGQRSVNLIGKYFNLLAPKELPTEEGFKKVLAPTVEPDKSRAMNLFKALEIAGQLQTEESQTHPINIQ